MAKLCDVPFEDLDIGDFCVSAIGTTGYISRLETNYLYPPHDEDRYDIGIEWDSGKSSYLKHYCATKIEYVGRL